MNPAKIEIPVSHLDGTSGIVILRQIPFSEIRHLGAVHADPFECARLYTGRDAGWIDTLTPESPFDLVAKGDKLNCDILVKFINRTSALNERLLPFLREAILHDIKGATAPSPAPCPREA